MHWMFDGLDEDGYQYGIYLVKRGQKWDYTISARMITGTMTISKDGVTYPEHTLPDEYFKSNRKRFDSDGIAIQFDRECKIESLKTLK